MTEKITFSLGKHEYIALCDLLKLTGIADSGGHAKILITEGLVYRNGELEIRKTARIRADEQITLEGICIQVTA